MSRPLVSVVMSVYNEEGYLKESVESILNQTFPDFELIIVNDGSTDKTQEILMSYKKVEKRIKIIANENNIGLAKSLNKGIQETKGKYIARMDSGDLCHPKRLEKQVDFFENGGDAYILGTQGIWIDRDKKIVGSWVLPLEVDGNSLFKTGGSIHPSIMVRRELFDRIGFYDPDFEISLEFDLYMRALKSGLKMANLDEVLIYVMERERGMTFSNLRKNQLNQFKLKIKYLGDFPSFENLAYTIRSLCGLLLPELVLKFLVKNLRRK